MTCFCVNCIFIYLLIKFLIGFFYLKTIASRFQSDYFSRSFVTSFQIILKCLFIFYHNNNNNNNNNSNNNNNININNNKIMIIIFYISYLGHIFGGVLASSVFILTLTVLNPKGTTLSNDFAIFISFISEYFQELFI